MTRTYGRVDSNHTEIVSALRHAGCYVLSLASIGKGVPDLLVWSPVTQQIYLLEVKTPSGTLTSAEQEWHSNYPGEVSIVRSIDDALRVVGRI